MSGWSSIIANRSRVKLYLLSICIILGASLCHASDALNAINDYQDLKSSFNSYKDEFTEKSPESISNFVQTHNPSPLSGMSALPVNDEIDMTGADARESVKDILAVNSVKERTMDYDDVQIGNGIDKGNSVNLEIAGNEQEKGGPISTDGYGDIIEGNVDAAIASAMVDESSDKSGQNWVLGNNMNITVRDISVTAINNVEGGIATAISNIIIEPVQIIRPTEICEKLR